MSASKHRVDPDDLVVVGGRRLRLAEVTRSGLVFDAVDEAGAGGRLVQVAFAWAAFAAETVRKGFSRVPLYFAKGRDKAREEAGVQRLSGVPKRELAGLQFRLRWTRGFLSLEEAGLASRSDGSMASAVDRIAETIAAERAPQDDQKPRKRQVNSKPGRDDPAVPVARPSVKTLRRWVNRYELGGRTILALRHGHFRSGNRPRRLEPAMVAVVRKVALTFMSEQRPSKATCLRAMRTAARELNEARVAQGLPLLRCPTRAVLYAEIRALPEAMVFAARFGTDKAAGKYGPLGAGLGVERPGQRVEMDEWDAHALTLIERAGLSEGLDAAWRDTAERHRLVVCEGIDAASGLTMGLSFADEPNTTVNALSCLAMVFSDKTRLALWAGATSRWDMCCSPEEVVTDNGAGFASTEFAGAVTGLLGDRALTPAGVAPLRARIERKFLTREQRLMPLVPGRTFSNPIDRGDYDSHARAAILDVVLRRLIIIDAVDVCANSPNTGRLRGATPLDKWDELVATYGVYPPPGPEERRDALGCQVERLTGRHGVRVLNVDYTSSELQRRFRHEGARKAVVSVDPADLGAVSVLTDDGWLSCGSRQRVMDGVPMDVWVAAEADLRRRHEARAKLSESVVLDAIERMRELVASAEVQFGLGSARPSQRELDRAEEQMLISFLRREADPPPAGRDVLASAVPRGTPVEPYAAMGGDAASGSAPEARHEVLDDAGDASADGSIGTEGGPSAEGGDGGSGRAAAGEAPDRAEDPGGTPPAAGATPEPDRFTPTIEEHDDDFDDL